MKTDQSQLSFLLHLSLILSFSTPLKHRKTRVSFKSFVFKRCCHIPALQPNLMHMRQNAKMGIAIICNILMKAFYCPDLACNQSNVERKTIVYVNFGVSHIQNFYLN